MGKPSILKNVGSNFYFVSQEYFFKISLSFSSCDNCHIFQCVILRVERHLVYGFN